MTLHKLKCWPQYFKEIVEGRKTFEMRKNDRDYHVGDKLLLQEYDPLNMSQPYSGKKQKVRVNYIVSGDDVGFKYGLQPGYVCMSIEPVEDGRKKKK